MFAGTPRQVTSTLGVQAHLRRPTTAAQPPQGL